MDEREIKAIIEALLFIWGGPFIYKGYFQNLGNK